MRLRALAIGYSFLFLGMAIVSVCLVVAGAFASPGATERVSVASDGSQGNSYSVSAAVSADGRYVAFQSGASNLVDGDTNGDSDIFIHDRVTGQTTLLANTSGGMNDVISADGRYVAFDSERSGLVPGDTNGTVDVFVHDRQTQETTRVSIASDGSEGDGWSDYSHISADGRYVAFESAASNLVAGDTNGSMDIFIHDRQTGQTERVSVASDGSEATGHSESPAINSDGRYVAFFSTASDLVAGDTNGTPDIFVHDRQTAQTERVSVASDGSQATGDPDSFPDISADGRYVAFASAASDLVAGDTNGTPDIFVHDRQTGQTTRVSIASDGSQANSFNLLPAINADGRYVAFMSDASNLVAGDTNGQIDIFVHDRVTGATERASVASNGAQSQGITFWWVPPASISANGRLVAFVADASDLVAGDTNGANDVFVHESASAVGGIAEYPQLESEATWSHGDSVPDAIALAGLATGAAVLLSAGAWYARRRWVLLGRERED